MTDELRAVVRAHEQRRAMGADQARQHLDDALGADRAGHVDGQALPGELVDDGQTLDLLDGGGRVEDEVVGPDHVGFERCVDARPGGRDALARHQRSHVGDPDASIAVARVLCRQLFHRRDDRRILGRHPALVAGCGSRHPEQPARPTKTGSARAQVRELVSSALRAH